MHHVIEGDSAVVLGHFEDGSIDAVVTDPPHGLFFMGSAWDADLPEQRIWDECFRVLKPGGHCFVMSSERLGCVAGLYMSLRKAGFDVDETQILNWVTLTGMPKSTDVAQTHDKRAFRAWLEFCGREFVACPDHKEPKDPETGEKQRCVECERIFAEGNLTHHDKRKAASAAVGGVYSGLDSNADRGQYVGHGHGGTGPNEREWTRAGVEGRASGADILSRLLASYPSAPAEQRDVWEAVVGDVPEGWPVDKPPGVRVKTGEYRVTGTAARKTGAGGVGAFETTSADSDVSEVRETTLNRTAPSTPIACETDGWRGSVSPFKPFCYPILHAMKPFPGTYADIAAENGGGVLNVGAAKIPYEDDDRVRCLEPAAQKQYARSSIHNWGGQIKGSPAGRVPANLLSHAGLLGELQKYADLDDWCEKLGLPDAAADLLEAGMIYAPKSSRAEKNRGLPEGYSAKRNPCAKPVALCAYLVTLCTREGDTVLDPFCGEAPVGVAAALLGRKFIGTELEPDFCETARLRIAHAAGVAENDETCAEVPAQPALIEECAK